MSITTKNILVTGANGGLGVGICQRLIDDFLSTQPSSTALRLIVTTRSTRKGQEIVRLLDAGLSKQYDTDTHKRITLQTENVELTNLLSIKALARKLNDSQLSQLDAIICNAGISGTDGLNWPLAVWSIMTAPRINTTFTQYKSGVAGLVTQPQKPQGSSSESNAEPEPPLGQVFCANVFGHYMLAHWLMPLLSACSPEQPGRIVWISSIEPQARHFNEDDLQGLKTRESYEHSKRLTDILGLTSDSPAVQPFVKQFLSMPKKSSSLSTVASKTEPRPVRSTPTMHVAHPGILVSTIIALYPGVQQTYKASIWFIRLLGGPWTTFAPHTAAKSITWLTYTSASTIADEEQNQGGPGGRKIKWGTGVTRWGHPSSRPTEVEGWGLNGSGTPFVHKFWCDPTLGRHPDVQEANREDVQEFDALGARVWQAMEELRTEWEDRLDGLPC